MSVSTNLTPLCRLGAVGLLVTGVLLGDLGVATAAPGTGACAGDANTGRVVCTYSFTGAEQEFLVPQGVTAVDVVAIGATGGSVNGNAGGSGAEVAANLPVEAGDVLVLRVGGDGTSRSVGNGLTVAGGWNGGGAGGSGQRSGGGSGGGASDVRLLPAGTTGSLASRVLVAAGGGGASAFYAGGAAGQPGATHSFDPTPVAQPGSATAGGAAGEWIGMPGQAGSLGTGGDGFGDGGDSSGGGGGGAGLYGGGGGGVDQSAAGGSSLVPSGGTVQLATDESAITVSYAGAVPTSPSGVTAERRDAGLSVAWTGVTSTDPNTPITGYRATATADDEDQTTASCESTTTSCVITGLTNGTSYAVDVVALNSVGSSSRAAAAAPVTPAGTPGVPSDVTAAVGDRTVTVAFEPAPGNGAPVTGYTVRATDLATGERAEVTGASSPLTLTDLVNGRSYRVELFASNAVGDGTVLEALATAVPVAPSVTVPVPTTSAAPTSSVAAPASTATTGPGTSLASTGADVFGVVGLGLGALVLGSVGMVAARRRTARG